MSDNKARKWELAPKVIKGDSRPIQDGTNKKRSYIITVISCHQKAANCCSLYLKKFLSHSSYSVASDCDIAGVNQATEG